MGVSSIKQIKTILKKGKESILLDLGKVLHPKLEGIIIPFKLKNYEEVIKISSRFKIDNEPLKTQYVRINKAPKDVQKLYSESISLERKNLPTYVLICETDKDSDKIEVARYRKKLFDIVVHLDMDYKEDSKDLWELWGIPRNDFNALVNLFSEIIDDEEMVDTLVTIVSILKEGIYDENIINARVSIFKMIKMISKIEDETERKEAMESFQKAMQESIHEETESKKPKKTKVKEKKVKEKVSNV